MKLIAFDLDGTLLTTEKELTDENRAALERAAEAGILLVPATGRFYGVIPENVRSLPWFRYYITINGAYVYDAMEERTLVRAEIPWRRAVEIMEYLDTLPIIYDCYMDNWGWMTRALYEQAADFAPHRHSLSMLRDYRVPVPELKAHITALGRDVQKIQMFFRDPELRLRSMEDMRLRFPDLAVTSSIPRNVELNSLDAQKGVALERLAALLGIPMEQTVAFGDDLNDVSMLKAAGIGVAMGNAGPEAKAAADMGTDSCDESGVGRAIGRLLDEKGGLCK